MAYSPSIPPTVPKAQQDPQPPWFFTGVTAFFYLQSTESGMAPQDSSMFDSYDYSWLVPMNPVRCLDLNSSSVKSENWVKPKTS